MLAGTDLLPLMQRRLREVTEVLDLPPSAAGPLMRECGWAKERLFERYWSDQDRILAECGVRARAGAGQRKGNQEDGPASASSSSAAAAGSNPNEARPPLGECEICYDDEGFPPHRMFAMACGHSFCRGCWGGFLEVALTNGPACIRQTCPAAGCSELVTEEEYAELAPPDHLARFRSYQLRNFVESNPMTRWCPGPGCERVAVGSGRMDGTESGGLVAECSDCDLSFCLRCGEEPHAPVGCRDLGKWNEKCKNESETANWILANTKPCPACKRPIEKSSGCMHMTCAQCKYDFCWMCSGKWSEHGERTGGYYACNKYSTSKEKEGASEDEKRRLAAKQSIERYTHYYERWAAHGASQTKAAKDLDEMREAKIMRLGDLQNTPVSQLKFVLEAMEQIAECRRVLKWTYGYGYYWMEEDSLRKNFFEYIQGDAESTLELLTEAVEKDLEEFFTEEKSLAEFGDFRGRLTGLTTTVKKYFTTMVTELEAGLPGVGSEVVRAVSLAANPAEEDPPKPRRSARLA